MSGGTLSLFSTNSSSTSTLWFKYTWMLKCGVTIRWTISAGLDMVFVCDGLFDLLQSNSTWKKLSMLFYIRILLYQYKASLFLRTLELQSVCFVSFCNWRGFTERIWGIWSEKLRFFLYFLYCFLTSCLSWSNSLLLSNSLSTSWCASFIFIQLGMVKYRDKSGFKTYMWEKYPR